MKKIDPTLIKGPNDGAFDKSLGLMLSGYFESRAEAGICVKALAKLDFRVVPSLAHPGMAEVFVKTLDWSSWKSGQKTAKEKAAFKTYWRWFPLIFFGIPVMGAVLGGLVYWYSFSGQLAHQGFLTNPWYAFWFAFGIVVLAGWGKLAWNGLKIKLGDYSSD